MKVTGIAIGLICISTLGMSASQGQQKAPGAGFAQAPALGTTTLRMEEVPAAVRHAADVALSGFGAGYSFVGAELDRDDVVAIYEIQATSADGRRIEVDVEASGKLEEVEIQLSREEIPAAVLEALTRLAPGLQASQEAVIYEKSLRPSRTGLLEVWYEFGGTNYDVEVRSDAKQVLIEPA